MHTRTTASLVCLVVSLAACSSNQRPEDRALARVRAAPCDREARRTPPDVAHALTGRDHAEKEVHDCERLVVGSEYGPLVGIYPIVDSIEKDESLFTGWTPVASLHNWGQGTYDHLKIAHGAHCLFLRKVGSSWEAHLDRRGFCPGRQLAAAEQPNLEAVAQKYSGQDTPLPDRPIYPSTARFRWDAVNQRHYIGIRCGDNWCSVGEQASLPTAPAIAGALIENMPGYFDEQPLPIVRDGVLTIGPVARVQPTDSLRHARENSAVLGGDHITYATVVVPRAGALPADVQTLEVLLGLSQDASSSARVGAGVALRLKGGLDARARSWNGLSSRPLGLTLVQASMHSAPGTVRWRWRDPANPQPASAPAEASFVPRSAFASPAADGSNDALAAVSTVAAAWIPCKVDNCCTAVW